MITTQKYDVRAIALAHLFPQAGALGADIAREALRKEQP